MEMSYQYRIIPDTLVDKVYSFLSANKYDGIRFFEECLLDHNEISPIMKIDIDGTNWIPHPVHFREGMQVRNFLRTCTECKDWNDCEFDDNWIPVVKKALIKHRVIILKKLEEMP